ncbi:MAG: hypothetical protein QM758_12540 [Armatimonas sp.]
MAKLNPKVALNDQIIQAKTFLTKDLKAIPADKQGTTFDGCSRSALSIVSECGGNCAIITKILQGASGHEMTREEMGALMHPFEVETEENVLAYLEEKSGELLRFISECDEDTLGDICPEFPWGQLTRFDVAMVPAGHMMYHDGQLNFIQTLIGDGDVHWME